MPESDPTPPGRALFLSYARDDSVAARRIADALRAFGLEVWFDQAELRGGDSWDQKIKRQIRECALFIPIISATTQARGEGYFRREWHLAVERTRDMAAGVSFMLPIVIDETLESDALVPDEFMRYQWTRLPRGLPSPEFVTHVKTLLEAPRTPKADRPQTRPPQPAQASAGDPSDDRRRRQRIPGWMRGVIVILIVVGVFFGRRAEIDHARPKPPDLPPGTAAAAPAAVAPSASDKSVAVLPFENMSEEKDSSAFFADGVQEDILTNLSFIRGIRVISRTSVLQYRGTTKSIGQIARELGVAYILEGSVRRAGNRVRVTGQLIRALTDEHVWAKAYDRDVTDVFAIQSELAQAIAGALQAAISPTAQTLLDAKPTTNAEAYDLYLKARAARESNGIDSLKKAEGWLVDAVQLDPGFAQAWAHLAAVHAYKYFTETDTSSERLAKAKAAIDTATRLAPDDPAVIEWKGDYLYYGYRDYGGAAAQYRHLLELRPNSAEAYGSLGLIYRRQGRWDESMTNFHKALEIDPHIARYRASLAESLAALRRYDEARSEYARLAEDNPAELRWPSEMGLVTFLASGSTQEMDSWIAQTKTNADNALELIAIRRIWARTKGDYAEAVKLDAQNPYDTFFDSPHWQQDIDAAFDLVGAGNVDEAKSRVKAAMPVLKAQLEEQPSSTTVWLYWGAAHAFLGDRETALEAERKLGELFPESKDALTGPENSRARASLLAWSGEKDRAIAELTRLFGVPFGANVYRVRADDEWLPLRDDPRFKALLADPKNNAPIR